MKKNGRCPKGEYYCYTNKMCKPIPAGFMVDPAGMLRKENGASISEEGLRDWFGKSKSKDGKGGWVNVVTGGTCASDEPGEGTPKCVSSAKRASMTKSERLSAARRKKAADPGQQMKTGAAKPTYVSTDSPKKKTREEEINLSDYFELVNDIVLTYKVGKNSENNLMEKNNCNHTKEGVKCPCHGKKRCPVVLEAKDHEYSMARSELSTIMSAAKRLKTKMAKGEGNVEAWVQSKITKAADYLDSAADYVDSGEMNEESDKKGKGSGTKDACYHKVKSRYSVWPSAYASGALVKCRKAGAANWGNKSEEKITDRILNDILSEKCWPGYKKKGMKTMFGKRYPNCVKKEDVTIEDAEGNTFAEVVDLIKPEPIKGFKTQVEEATKLQSQTGNVVMVTVSWRGKYYALKIFFPQVKLPSRKEISDELQKVYPGSTVVHHAVSEIQPGQPLVQSVGPHGGSFAAAGPSKKYVKPYGEQVEIEEDWQSVNRKDKTDGLSQAAVNAYRRENPGSKLKTAVTEKNPTGKRASRRKSFCRRMKGMKSKLTSAKTARDPDSNINKALRRWNCN